MKKTTLTLITLLFSVFSQAADKVTLTVQNSLKTSRQFEVVEADAQSVKKKLEADTFIVTDADGKEITSQITSDGKLLFQASVGANGKSVYYAVAGTPKEYAKQASGRLFHERGTEFGWENDRVAYRIYGGGAAVGYDLFNKSTTELMLDYWYKSEQDSEMRNVTKQLKDRGFAELAEQVYNAYCYHIDHGKGMDCYTVGPTLGAGANALVNKDGSLCMPKCYKKYEILDNGPLRFIVKLTYPEIEYEGQKIVETRIISIDAGSQFCKVCVSYEGLNGNPQIASGVVVHKQNPTAYVLNKDAGYVGYEDLGDVGTYSYIPKKYHEELSKQMGKIYVGTIYPTKLNKTEFQANENGVATGHVLAIANYTPSYIYYFGTCWSKNASFGVKSLSEWESLLGKVNKQVKSPMKVVVK